MMRPISLTQGLVAWVDDDAHEALARHHWCAVKKNRTFYAQRQVSRVWILMHRIVCSATEGMVVDHKNGNGLDNRRDNLRACSHRQNCQNQLRQKRAGKTSRFKGVYLEKSGRWCARIRAGELDARGASRKISLGMFEHEEDAARAYDRAAVSAFGEFAALNFPPGGRVALPADVVTDGRRVRRPAAASMLVVNGVTRSFSEWAALVGMRRETLFQRIRKGVPPSRALDPAPMPSGRQQPEYPKGRP